MRMTLFLSITRHLIGLKRAMWAQDTMINDDIMPTTPNSGCWRSLQIDRWETLVPESRPLDMSCHNTTGTRDRWCPQQPLKDENGGEEAASFAWEQRKSFLVCMTFERGDPTSAESRDNESMLCLVGRSSSSFFPLIALFRSFFSHNWSFYINQSVTSPF